MKQVVVANYEQSARYEQNREKASGLLDYCVVCGKNVDPDTAKVVQIIDHGITILLDGTEPEQVDGGTSIGEFYVGADCYRKLRRFATEREGGA